MSMESNYQRAIEYCEEQGWHFDRVDDRCVIKLGMNLGGNLKSCHLIIHVKERNVLVLAVTNLNVDVDDKNAVYSTVEYLTRANYNLILGGFEYDHRDGEVRYRVSMPLRGEHEALDKECLDNCVNVALMMLERYGKGLVKCMMGMGCPEADIEEAESDN